jgi:D-aspartate ligase
MRTTPGAVPAVILKFDPNVYHHGALGIVRSLGRLGVPVHAVQEDRWAPMGRSRYLRGRFPWPQASDHGATLEQLMSWGSRMTSRAVLIPTDDIASIFVADHAGVLEQFYRFPRQEPGVARALCSKAELYHLCKQHGVPTPEVWFPTSRDDVRAISAQATYPLVLKAINPWLLDHATRRPSVVIANDAEELHDLYDRLEDPQKPNLMVQEYIPGGADSVWMFNGYLDQSSEMLVHFTGQKIRQHPPYTGMTTLGVCRANAEVEATSERFLKSLGYKGIVDMGYRYDARDGQYKLLDVNPRIGATFRLFVGTSGIDVARALYADLTGGSVDGSATREGRRWLVENYDVVSSVRYVRDGALSLAEWRRSFEDVDEAAWFAADDPLPFVVMSLRFAVRAVGKLTRLRSPQPLPEPATRQDRPATASTPR